MNIYRNLFEIDYDEISAQEYDNVKKKLWFRVKCFSAPIVLQILALYLIFMWYDRPMSNFIYYAEKYYWLAYFISQMISFGFYDYCCIYAIGNPEILLDRTW